MHKNIFLASYPKSGNTWLRSIIGNFYNFDKEFSLNDLKLIPLLSIKKHFSEFDNKVYIPIIMSYILIGFHKILLNVKKY